VPAFSGRPWARIGESFGATRRMGYCRRAGWEVSVVVDGFACLTAAEPADMSQR
jgi:hypothetical protein